MRRERRQGAWDTQPGPWLAAHGHKHSGQAPPQLGCITVEIFIIHGVVISRAAGGGCRGSELSVT